MNANWIQSAIWVAMCLMANLGIAGEPSEAREDLTTLDGRQFHRVRLVKVDPNGLLFRHRDGIAKVTFDDLDQGFREYYGYDEQRARDFEKRNSRTVRKTTPAPKITNEEEEPEVVITYRTRTTIPIRLEHPYGHAQAACGGVPWYSHWARFDPRLAYAHFPCRQLAKRDFLISSGILPAPPGVTVRRLRW